MKQQSAIELAEHINTVDKNIIQALAEPAIRTDMQPKRKNRKKHGNKPRSSHWWIKATLLVHHITLTASTPEQWEEIRYMWQMFIDDDKAA